MKSKIITLPLLLSLLMVAVACSGATTATTPAEATVPAASESAASGESTPEAAGHGSAVHWSYEGEEGPANWGSIDSAYALCGTGTTQSPVDVVSADFQDAPPISFHYEATPINIVNNGHTVEVVYEPGSYMEVDGQRYDLVQFHYHVPSEHTIDGQSFKAEVHLVHKNAAGQNAVIGLLLDEGAENAGLQPFIADVAKATSEETELPGTVDATAFLPSFEDTIRYQGSLTTPPCTEGIQWFLMTSPVQASAEQLAALSGVFNGNNRPVQALNGRVLEFDYLP